MGNEVEKAWNRATENVSWSKPFGDSALGGTGEVVKKGLQATTPFINYDAQHGGHLLVNPFDRTIQKPVGGEIGKGMYGNPNSQFDSEGRDRKTGKKVLERTQSEIYGGVGAGPPRQIQDTSGGGGALAYQGDNNTFKSPTPNDTSGEDAFRQTYLSALKPQVAFTFNAQNPSTFGSAGNPNANVRG